jgi:hypothetical protein
MHGNSFNSNNNQQKNAAGPQAQTNAAQPAPAPAPQQAQADPTGLMEMDVSLTYAEVHHNIRILIHSTAGREPRIWIT